MTTSYAQFDYVPMILEDTHYSINAYTIANGRQYFTNITSLNNAFVILGKDTIIKKSDDMQHIDGFPLTQNRLHAYLPDYLYFFQGIYAGFPSNGLIRYDMKKDSFFEFTPDNSNLPSRNIFSLASNESGRTMVISAHKKLAFIENDSIWTIELDTDNMPILPNYFNFKMSVFYKDYFYYQGAYDDLIRVEEDTVTFIGKSNYSDNPDSSKIPIISSFMTTGRGKLWFMLKNKELISYDGKEFEKSYELIDALGDDFSFPYKSLIFFDKIGNLWFNFVTKQNETEREIYHFGMIDTAGKLQFDLHYKDSSIVHNFKGVKGIYKDEFDESNRKVYIPFSFYNAIVIYDPDKTGVADLEAIPSILSAKIYPNPCMQITNVELYASWKAAENLEFSLCDYLGKTYELKQPSKEYDKITGKLKCQLDFTDIHAGHYYLVIQNGKFTICKAVIID
jgi:type IX secretion system substrate protein